MPDSIFACVCMHALPSRLAAVIAEFMLKNSLLSGSKISPGPHRVRNTRKATRVGQNCIHIHRNDLSPVNNSVYTL